jgi:hypothetical protein
VAVEAEAFVASSKCVTAESLASVEELAIAIPH